MPRKSDKVASFEAAVQRLEELIEDIEEGQIPLSEFLKHFKEGETLLKYCQKQLADTELALENFKKEHTFEKQKTKPSL